MNVQLEGIENRGVPGDERLVLRVLEETDLAYYVVLLTRSSPGGGGVYAGASGAFWFPTTDVSSGDRVFLYTGPGASHNERNAHGGTDWIFHWGRDETIWGYERDTAVLVEANGWITAAATKDTPA